jgi:ABC-type amino acid transport substrate-binding protein
MTMTAAECLEAASKAGAHYQQPINEFVDAFRRASDQERGALIIDPLLEPGPLAGLVAAVVSALCREVGLAAPAWVAATNSPEAFFALPARSFEMRVRLMLESPAPFRIRNVFVPENYLSRA